MNGSRQVTGPKREGARSGAFAGIPQRSPALHPVARFLLDVFRLVLGLAPLLLGLALLLTHLVVGELAFLLLQLAFDPVSLATHLDPFR